MGVKPIVLSKGMLKKLKKENGIKPENTQLFELDCGGEKFKIWVAPGQLVNNRKMCKKLLAIKKLENNAKENKKFISKGYKPKGY